MQSSWKSSLAPPVLCLAKPPNPGMLCRARQLRGSSPRDQQAHKRTTFQLLETWLSAAPSISHPPGSTLPASASIDSLPAPLYFSAGNDLPGGESHPISYDAFGDFVEKQADGCLLGWVGGASDQRVKVCLSRVPELGNRALPACLLPQPPLPPSPERVTVTSGLIFTPLA